MDSCYTKMIKRRPSKMLLLELYLMPVFGASLVYVTSVMPLHASTSWYHKYWRDDDNEINFLKNRL